MSRLPKIRNNIAIMCIMTLLIGLLPTSALLAKEKKSYNWDNVLRLRIGDLVLVRLFNSKETHVGKVDRVEPNSIALTTKEESLLIPRDKIKLISYTTRPKAAKAGAVVMVGGLGLIVGGLVGGTAKDLSDLNQGKLDSSSGKHGEAFYITGALALAGGLGMLILGGKPKVIYEAKSAPKAGN
jgi:hypothetical protein